MIKWLKKHFIPHKQNNHRPHFLRAQNVRATLLLVIALELLVFVLPTLTLVSRVSHNTNVASVLPGVLAVLTNEEREKNNVPDLVVSPILTKAAEMKAHDMAEKSYFAHTSPEGKTPWYWLDQVGYTYDYAGENLAINFSDSEDVTNAWMNSPTHRANIVKSAYKEVGTGIATGIYEGRRTIFVAQVYANPRNLANSSSALAKATPKTAPKTNTTNSTNSGDVKTTDTKIAIANETSEKNVLGESVKSAEPQIGTTSVRSKDFDISINTGTGASSPDSSFRQPTSFEKITTSPRHALTMTLFVILGVVLVALILNIVIKSNIQHPDLITNGLFVTAVIVAILVANSYIGTKNLAINQGYDYSREQVANVSGAIDLAR